MSLKILNDSEAELIRELIIGRERHPNFPWQTDEQAIAHGWYWGFGANNFNGVIDDVWEERKRQIAKRGLQERASGTNANEWADWETAAKVTHDMKERFPDGPAGPITWVDILKEEVYEAFAEEDPDALRVELIQVMAVAASWIQDLDRRGDLAP